jgi:hypothetical protein
MPQLLVSTLFIHSFIHFIFPFMDVLFCLFAVVWIEFIASTHCRQHSSTWAMRLALASTLNLCTLNTHVCTHWLHISPPYSSSFHLGNEKGVELGIKIIRHGAYFQGILSLFAKVKRVHLNVQEEIPKKWHTNVRVSQFLQAKWWSMHTFWKVTVTSVKRFKVEHKDPMRHCCSYF